MKRTEANLLRDILAAIGAIRRHQPSERDVLGSDELISTLIHKKLEIIGEAASRLSAATRAGAPAIPWRDIVGMRNRLVHDYADVDWNVVWSVLHTELEPLRAQAEAILKEREGHG